MPIITMPMTATIASHTMVSTLMWHSLKCHIGPAFHISAFEVATIAPSKAPRLTTKSKATINTAEMIAAGHARIYGR